MTSAHRVLLICYYFPPLGGAGINRPMNLVKYLPDHGVACDVLTVKPVAYRHYEPELLDEIENINVHRAGSRDPQRLLYLLGVRRVREGTIRKSRGFSARFFPDSKIGWVGPAVRLGRRLMMKRCYDAIISTSPPVSCHLVGREIHRQCNVPWIADFRDLWTAYSIEEWYKQQTQVERARKLLDEIRKSADMVTAVNRATAAYTGATEVIRNAFDPQRARLWRSKPDTRRFRIGLLGTIDAMRSAGPLLKLLARLREDHPGQFDTLRLIQVGDIHDPEGFRAAIEDCGLGGRIESYGVQTRGRSIELLSPASALYIGTTGASSKAITTGRVFDLIASGRPMIVAAQPDSELSLLTGKLPGVIRFDPNTNPPPAVVSALSALVERWRDGELAVTPLQAYSRPFSAGYQAEQFAGLIKDLSRH